MQIADFTEEHALRVSHPNHILIGVDEAGRGPLAGPVVAAACAMRSDVDPTNPLWDLVRDSKKLSENQREKVYDFIFSSYYVGIGETSPETIDRINILQATFLAMKSAISNLTRTLEQESDSEQYLLMIDGSHTIPNISHTQKPYTKGDSRIKSIAAASIIAKVTRDRKMKEYDALFPQYGFGAHKGYGTKVHMDALQEHGVTPIHRKSFAPVKKSLHISH